MFAPAYPDFLYAAPPMFAYAAFCKESCMKMVYSTKLHRKYGEAHHCFCIASKRGCALLESIGNKPSSSQVRCGEPAGHPSGFVAKAGRAAGDYNSGMPSVQLREQALRLASRVPA
jgi:hypothetical protein